MPTYPISNVTRRVVYDGSAGVGPYAFTFEVLADTDIAVYRNDTLLGLTTNYTVTINANGTGSVTLTAAASAADVITIVGNRAIQRTTDFVTGGDLFANTLNDELDSQTIFVQQVAETADRSVKIPVTDPTTVDVVLPSYDDRANKILSFNAGGDVETVLLKTDITNAAASAAAAANSATLAQNALANFNGIYYGPSASDPALDPNGNAINIGDIYLNSTTSVMRVYTASGWVDSVTADPVTVFSQTFSGDGSTTNFTLSSAPASLNAVSVFISGVSQVPTTSFTISGSTLTFAVAPPTGANNILVRWFSPIAAGVPDDLSVTTAKIQNGAVTSAKIADGSVLPAKLSTGGPSWTSGGTVTIGSASLDGNLSLYRSLAGPVLTFENGDTTNNNGDLFGVINFQGNDASSGSSGVRARIRASSTGVTAGGQIEFAVAGGGAGIVSNTMTINSANTTINGPISLNAISCLSVNASSSITSGGTVTGFDTNFTAIQGSRNFVGNVAMLSTDTQVDVDITSVLSATTNAPSYFIDVDVVGTYFDAAGLNSARLFKNWAQMVHWNGTTWTIAGAVLKFAAFNSDATNFPAGAVNASKALLVVSGTSLLLRMQNRTTPAAGSVTGYRYNLLISGSS